MACARAAWAVSAAKSLRPRSGRFPAPAAGLPAGNDVAVACHAERAAVNSAAVLAGFVAGTVVANRVAASRRHRGRRRGTGSDRRLHGRGRNHGHCPAGVGYPSADAGQRSGRGCRAGHGGRGFRRLTTSRGVGEEARHENGGEEEKDRILLTWALAAPPPRRRYPVTDVRSASSACGRVAIPGRLGQRRFAHDPPESDEIGILRGPVIAVFGLHHRR